MIIQTTAPPCSRVNLPRSIVDILSKVTLEVVAAVIAVVGAVAPDCMKTSTASAVAIGILPVLPRALVVRVC